MQRPHLLARPRMAGPRSAQDHCIMAAHNDYGNAAEELACDALRQRGWAVLERNWRYHRKEIDLVMRRRGIVAFVEVRARESASHGHPLATIGPRKRRDLEMAARGWVALNGRSHEAYRFDVVTVLGRSDDPGCPPLLEHFEDAWRL
jgi:putative endonuclease